MQRKIVALERNDHVYWELIMKPRNPCICLVCRTADSNVLNVAAAVIGHLLRQGVFWSGMMMPEPDLNRVLYWWAISWDHFGRSVSALSLPFTHRFKVIEVFPCTKVAVIAAESSHRIEPPAKRKYRRELFLPYLVWSPSLVEPVASSFRPFYTHKWTVGVLAHTWQKVI